MNHDYSMDKIYCHCGAEIDPFSHEVVCDDEGTAYCSIDCFEDEITARMIDEQPMPWE